MTRIKSKPKLKSQKSNHSFFTKSASSIKRHSDYDILACIMESETCREALNILNISYNSLRNYLIRHDIKYYDLKMLSFMSGVALKDSAKQLAKNLCTGKQTPQNSQGEIPDLSEFMQLYYELFSKERKTELAADFFQKTRIVAAVCATNTLKEAANILELSETTLQNQIGEHYDSIRNSTKRNTPSNIEPSEEIQFNFIDTNLLDPNDDTLENFLSIWNTDSPSI